MKKRNKIIYSIIAIVFSMLATAVGFALISDTEMPFLYHFLCNFVFMMQFMTTVWIAIAVFVKDKE